MKNLVYFVFLLSTVAGAQVQIGSGVQVSGAGAVNILSSNKPSGTLASAKLEYQSVANGATQHLLVYSGGSPGYVSRVWVGVTNTTQDPSNDTINVYLNGSGTPTISMPVQNFFLASYFWRPTMPFTTPTVASTYFTRVNQSQAHANYGVEFKLPIPFSSAVTIDWVNNSGASETLWATMEYHTGIPITTWGSARVLHADAITKQTGIAANAQVTLSNYTGGQPGQYAGLWWMEDDIVGSISAHGAPLEGDIALTLDGGGSPNIQSSGTEDWFGFSDYFAGNGTGGTGGGNTSQVQGGYKDADGQIAVTLTPTSTYGIYTANAAARFHVLDPIYFNSGEKTTWNCGDTSQSSFTGTCTLWSTVFYYTQN